MSDASIAKDLEAALRDRARNLAEEHLAHARQIREQLIQEENERLRLREEREVLSAKDMAERLYRRRVQASELTLREQLERQRWDLVQAVMRRLGERLTLLTKDVERYAPLLMALLAEAARRIPERELVAELSAQDLEHWRSRWDAMSREAAPDKAVSLHPEPLSCLGGVRVRDKDNRVRVDNTFEGRMERLGDALHGVVSERLFARVGDDGGDPPRG